MVEKSLAQQPIHHLRFLFRLWQLADAQVGRKDGVADDRGFVLSLTGVILRRSSEVTIGGSARLIRRSGGTFYRNGAVPKDTVLTYPDEQDVLPVPEGDLEVIGPAVRRGLGSSGPRCSFIAAGEERLFERGRVYEQAARCSVSGGSRCGGM